MTSLVKSTTESASAYRPTAGLQPLPVGTGGKLARGKRRMSHAINLATLLVLDYTAIIIGVTSAGYARFGTIDKPMVASAMWFFALLYPIAAVYNHAWSPTIFSNKRQIVLSGIKTILATNLLFTLALFCLQLGIEFSRLLIGYMAIASVVAVFVTRILAARILSGTNASDLLCGLALVDGDTMPESFPPHIQARFASAIGLKPQAHDRSQVEKLVKISQSFDFVRIYCAPDQRPQWAEILRCVEGQTELRVADLDELRPLSLLRRGDRYVAVLSRSPLNWRQAMAKRALDLGVTLAILPILLPIMAVVALAIRLESSGPILFKQERIGLGNRSFRMLKFRSMYADRSDHEGAQSAVKGDCRITRVGAIIRRTSIDELPQFFNVLIGDMSIVGPRPHAYGSRAGDRLFWEVDNSYWHRHITKPGITGLAQVRGFRGNTFEEQDLQNRLDADLEYIANWTLMWDIEIILATLRVLKHERAF